MKTLALAFALFVAAAAAAEEKPASAFAQRVAPAPLGDVLPSDLAADPDFGIAGSTIVDFNTAGANADGAYRVFASSDGGYWLAGVHTGVGHGIDLAIVKLLPNGAVDANYNGDGKLTIPSTLEQLRDVAIGPGDALYFVGTHIALGATDTDIEIDCIDATGEPCADFGAGGIKQIVLDQGDAAHDDDRPNRIIYAYSNLYIVGETDTATGPSNFAMFAIKLSAASGALDPGFGNTASLPGVFTYNADLTANGRDVAFDVLAYSPSAFAVRLVLVGQVQRTPGDADIDGLVFSIDGITGDLDPFIGNLIYADLGVKKQDSALRVIRRHNGGFVVAGVAADDSQTPAQYQLMLKGYRADGSVDDAFGDAGNGLTHKLLLSGTNIPFGLAERADTRDLVVGMNIKADLFGDGHPLQAVTQLDANGNTQHALATLDLAGTPQNTQGFDLLIDANRVVSAGTRLYSQASADSDMTIARYLPLDTIFADRFGGVTSD